MHTAEEVRIKINYLRGLFGQHALREMLLAYVDLLEAMEECSMFPHSRDAQAIQWLRQRAAEKQKARKGWAPLTSPRRLR